MHQAIVFPVEILQWFRQAKFCSQRVYILEVRSPKINKLTKLFERVLSTMNKMKILFIYLKILITCYVLDTLRQ